jgi:hypothetical protein
VGLQGGACRIAWRRPRGGASERWAGVADAVDRDAAGVRWEREESEQRDRGEGNRLGRESGGAWKTNLANSFFST